MEKNYLEHFNQRLTFPKSSAHLEGNGDETAASVNESDVKKKLATSRETLHKAIEKYAKNDKHLKKKANEIIKRSRDPLKAVAMQDNKTLAANPQNTNLLEVIVFTDGSRPSFLIKNGKIDFTSSPAGEWENPLVTGEINVGYAIQCVGRINIGIKHKGTGFLIHKNLVITNKHVLQAVADLVNGKWVFKEGAMIDFGYEYKTTNVKDPRLLKKLVFTTPGLIDKDHIDHTKVDLALIEIEPVDQVNIPMQLLQTDTSITWAWPDTTTLYTIGYPGDPGLNGVVDYGSDVLYNIFKDTYGCKRLAPGKVMTGPQANPAFPLRLTHDATTLGGNSGSLMVTRSKEYIASGLHYGGEFEQPRENWGHVLGNILDAKNSAGKSLLDCLDEYNVIMTKSDA
ncbi:MAG: trypsin-like peptidase domain-containing protein [Chitinophagaceae bacterium]